MHLFGGNCGLVRAAKLSSTVDLQAKTKLCRAQLLGELGGFGTIESCHLMLISDWPESEVQFLLWNWHMAACTLLRPMDSVNSDRARSAVQIWYSKPGGKNDTFSNLNGFMFCSCAYHSGLVLGVILCFFHMCTCQCNIFAKAEAAVEHVKGIVSTQQLNLMGRWSSSDSSCVIFFQKEATAVNMRLLYSHLSTI